MVRTVVSRGLDQRWSRIAVCEIASSHFDCLATAVLTIFGWLWKKTALLDDGERFEGTRLA